MAAEHPAVCVEIASAIDDYGRGAKSLLARAAGVSATTVGRWYLGDDSPRPELWRVIEDALSLDVGTLKAAAGNPPAPMPSADQRRLDRVERRLGRVEKKLEALLRAIDR